MAEEISLFPSYTTKENRITNYTILLVRLIYEESPKLYELLIQNLMSPEIISVLPSFRQQASKGSSVPDAVIAQQSYDIYIETKVTNWFHDDQLKRHLEALAREPGGTKLLIALSSFDDGGQQQLEDRYRKLAKGTVANVRFRALSFDEFLNALPQVGPESSLANFISQYRTFLEREEVLGGWEDFLDVVNCATWPEHFRDVHVYTCPAEGAAYSHRRCKYLGLYKDKTVSYVAEIRAVVEAFPSGKGETVWINTGEREADLVKAAVQRAHCAWGDEWPKDSDEKRRIFVLGEPHATEFIKDSPGGMLGSKRYFDISMLNASNTEELARLLNGRRWSELE